MVEYVELHNASVGENATDRNMKAMSWKVVDVV
jgi:hypothetical protein